MGKSSILRRLMIVYLFAFLAAPLSYLIRVLYARNLTLEEYGLFYSILALFGLINAFNDLGTSPALIHFLPKFIKNRSYKKIKSAFTFVFSLETITFILLLILGFLFKDLLANSFFKTSLIKDVLIIFVFAFYMQGIFDLICNIFKGYRMEKYYASSNPLRIFSVLLLSIIALPLFKGKLLFAFSLIWAVSFLLMILVYYIPFSKIASGIFKLKSIPKLLFFDSENYSLLLKYGFFVMFSAGAATLLGRTDVLMLTYFEGVSSVGLYEIALPIASILLVVITPITSFLFPNISHFYHIKDFKTIRAMLKAIYNTGLFLFLPLGLIFFLFPQEIIVVLFGPKYASAKIALQILSIGFIFKGFSVINFSVTDGIGEVKKKSFIIMAGAAVNVLLNFLLIPMFSIKGAAIATTASFALMFAISLYYIEIKIRFEPSYSNWAKTILNSILFVILVYLLKTWLELNMYAESIIVITVSGAVYLAIGFAWKIIDYNNLKNAFKHGIGLK